MSHDSLSCEETIIHHIGSMRESTNPHTHFHIHSCYQVLRTLESQTWIMNILQHYFQVSNTFLWAYIALVNKKEIYIILNNLLIETYT